MALVTNGTSVVRMRCDVHDCMQIAVVTAARIIGGDVALLRDCAPPRGWVSVLVEGRVKVAFDACGPMHASRLFARRVSECV